jgi:putative component of toxin-antitoxin plasmid stabilization module
MTASEPDDLLYGGEWLRIRAMKRRNGSYPAKEWADSLDKKGKGQLLAAAMILETTLRANRPPAGRAGLVNASKQGLWELRVTKAGSTPPHLRLLFLRRGQTLWVANGFTKQQNKLSSTDIALGDSIALEWLRSRGEAS